MANKTQEQVASVMGVHMSMVGHYEVARKISKMPPYDVILMVAEYLNVDHDWLGTGFERAPETAPLTTDEIAQYLWEKPELKNPKFSDLIALVRFAESRYRK